MAEMIDTLKNKYRECRRTTSNLYYDNFIYHRYFDETRSIFIHIPKTAGTSIAKALYGKDPRHIPLDKFERKNPYKFQNYFKFTFVRNPLHRLASSYFYARSLLPDIDIRHPIYFIEKYNSFDDFVLKGIDQSTKEHYFFGLQTRYLLNRNSSMNSLDFIGKFENLESDFKVVSEKIGIAVKIGHEKQGEIKNYDHLFTEKLRNKVKEIFAEDYRLLDY
ncbi:MAG: hypothetical protein GKR93_08540 [Gammaproteobacteria bacterium]|nr:hypothetical protein [Gammaproteobacteria bacterium]